MLNIIMVLNCFYALVSFLHPMDSGFLLKETDQKNIRRAKIRAEMQDMEESLLRAKLEASLADGVSWGMREDAIEVDEVCFTLLISSICNNSIKL